MQERVSAGMIPGILAYRGDMPIGWCSVGLRSLFPTLATSKATAPLDDRPVWSVVCFYVARRERCQGIHQALLVEVA
jgi:hypothetical protein